MKDFHLRFARTAIADLRKVEIESAWYDNADYAIFDLVNGDADDIPKEAGAYVLGTADGTMLVYPWGMSPIYYVGQTERSLRSYLTGSQSHRANTQGAIDNHLGDDEGAWWYPRYQYGAAFGAHAVWYLAGEIDPQNVEATLINAFYETYGAIPTANQVWPKFKGNGD